MVDYHTSARGIMDLGHPEDPLGRQRDVERQVKARGHPYQGLYIVLKNFCQIQGGDISNLINAPNKRL